MRLETADSRAGMRREARPARLLLFAIGAAALLAGCASVSRDAGFSEVQRTVAARIDKKAVWKRGTAEDAEVAAAVRSMLADSLSVDEAVQIALLNNRALQATYEELGIAQAELVEAGLLENPVFGAEVLLPGPEMTFAVVQDFLSVLTVSARRQIAADALDRVTFEVGHRVLDLAAEVRAAYYALLADEQALGLLRQVVSSTEAAAELAERQRQAGSLSRRDQLVQQQLYGESLAELARTEVRLYRDREALNRLLGLWGADTGWKLPDRLPEVPETTPPLDRLEALAVEQRLDLAAARKDVQTIAETLDMNRRYRFLSALGIGFTAERDAEGKWVKGPSVEFGFPLFNWGQGRIRRLEAEQRRAQHALAGLGVDIRSEIREARARLQAAQEAALYYRRVLLPLNEQVVSETQRFYNGMLVSVYELLESKRDQIEAAREYIEAARDYWEARANLERAVGSRLPDLPAGASRPGTGEAAPAPAQQAPAAPPAHQH